MMFLLSWEMKVVAELSLQCGARYDPTATYLPRSRDLVSLKQVKHLAPSASDNPTNLSGAPNEIERFMQTFGLPIEIVHEWT